jgi:hypothetical protein
VLLFNNLLTLGIKMPTQKPRVMLTLDDDINALFERLGELEGRPKTKIIVEYLNAMRPHATLMIEALEAIKDNKSPSVIIDKMALDSFQQFADASNVIASTRTAIADKYGDKND